MVLVVNVHPMKESNQMANHANMNYVGKESFSTLQVDVTTVLRILESKKTVKRVKRMIALTEKKL